MCISALLDYLFSLFNIFPRQDVIFNEVAFFFQKNGLDRYCFQTLKTLTILQGDTLPGIDLDGVFLSFRFSLIKSSNLPLLVPRIERLGRNGHKPDVSNQRHYLEKFPYKGIYTCTMSKRFRKDLLDFIWRPRSDHSFREHNHGHCIPFKQETAEELHEHLSCQPGFCRYPDGIACHPRSRYILYGMSIHYNKALLVYWWYKIRGFPSNKIQSSRHNL